MSAIKTSVDFTRHGSHITVCTNVKLGLEGELPIHGEIHSLYTGKYFYCNFSMLEGRIKQVHLDRNTEKQPDGYNNESLLTYIKSRFHCLIDLIPFDRESLFDDPDRINPEETNFLNWARRNMKPKGFAINVEDTPGNVRLDLSPCTKLEIREYKTPIPTKIDRPEGPTLSLVFSADSLYLTRMWE